MKCIISILLGLFLFIPFYGKTDTDILKGQYITNRDSIIQVSTQRITDKIVFFKNIATWYSRGDEQLLYKTFDVTRNKNTHVLLSRSHPQIILLFEKLSEDIIECLNCGKYNIPRYWNRMKF